MPPDPIDTTPLESRPESAKGLLRFADPGPNDVPKLNYSLPLPNSYEGQFYLEMNLQSIPYNELAVDGESLIPKSIGDDDGNIGELIKRKPEVIPKLIKRPSVIDPLPQSLGSPRTPPLAVPPQQDQPIGLQALSPAISSAPTLVSSDHIEYLGDRVSVTEIELQAKKQKALVFYQGFSGLIKHTFVPEAARTESANPRFVIIEKYRLSSLFGDYGAGRTVATFSLWPGEETTLFVRSWRRTERKFKEASSIFDSYTTEAAQEFETSLDRENAKIEESEITKEWQAEGGFGIDLGFFKIGGGGGGGGTSKDARETMSKTVSRVSSHHASKSSAKRETSVSTELEVSEAAEFESITERKVKNVNLSRVLNVVCRELNQEFTTYLSLVDVTVAFANDRHVFEIASLRDLDRLVAKYVSPAWVAERPAEADDDPRKYVTSKILDQISKVVDYRGTEKEFVEEADRADGTKYWRVRRQTDPGSPNPFYDDDSVPHDGVILEARKHTVKTDSIIVDSLLGHGVALDTYALATQQETLRRIQLENRKMELALQILADGDEKKGRLYDKLFNPKGKVLELRVDAVQQEGQDG